MKIRQDFVTNSSSSSFVIYYKAISEVDKKVLEQYPFIKNYISTLEKTIFNNPIESIEDLNTWFIGQYGWKSKTVEEVFEDDEDLKEMYEEQKKYIEEGYNIAFKSVDYSDETTEEMLRNLNDEVNFIVKGEY